MSRKPSTTSLSLSSRSTFWPHPQDMRPHKSVSIGIHTLDLAQQGLQSLDPSFGEWLWRVMRRRGVDTWSLCAQLEAHIEGRLQEQGVQ